MGVDMIGDWAKTKAFLGRLDKEFQKAYKKGLANVGLEAERALKKGMTEGAPGGHKYAPNHPFTIARKGSSKPLINHSDLRNSIKNEIVDGATVFAGINRKELGKDGKPLVNIAAIHEFGDGNGGDLLIQVTSKMRAYLHSQGLHLKASTKYVRIPRRPTFEPVFEAEKDNWQKVFVDTVAKGTAGGGD